MDAPPSIELADFEVAITDDASSATITCIDPEGQTMAINMDPALCSRLTGTLLLAASRLEAILNSDGQDGGEMDEREGTPGSAALTAAALAEISRRRSAGSSRGGASASVLPVQTIELNRLADGCLLELTVRNKRIPLILKEEDAQLLRASLCAHLALQ